MCLDREKILVYTCHFRIDSIMQKRQRNTQTSPSGLCLHGRLLAADCTLLILSFLHWKDVAAVYLTGRPLQTIVVQFFQRLRVFVPARWCWTSSDDTINNNLRRLALRLILLHSTSLRTLGCPTNNSLPDLVDAKEQIVRDSVWTTFFARLISQNASTLQCVQLPHYRGHSAVLLHVLTACSHLTTVDFEQEPWFTILTHPSCVTFWVPRFNTTFLRKMAALILL